MSFTRIFSAAPLQIAQALIGFAAIAAFTRLMSAEEFGRYALALSASMLAHTLAFTWAEAAAYRFFAAAKAEGRLRPHFATLLALCIGLAVGTVALTALLLFLVGAHRELVTLTLFAAGSAVFRFLTRIVRETERAALETQRYAAAESAYLAIGFAAGIAFLTVFDLGAAAPFAGLMLAGAIMLLVDAPRLFQRAKGGEVSIDRVYHYAAYGAPLAAALAVDLGVQTLARFILADQAGAAELGAYAAAFGLARPLDIIFMWAGAALMPALMAAHDERGADAARAEAKRIFTLVAAIAAPAALGLALIAEPLSRLLIGPALSAGAAHTLPWLALAALLSGFNLYYWSEAFALRRRTGVRALIMTLPGFAQIALTLWFAPLFGAAGAAIAAACAAALGFLLLALIGRQFLPLPLPFAALARIAAACGVMALVILALPRGGDLVTLLLSVLFGALAYGAAAIFLNIGGLKGSLGALSKTFAAKLRPPVHASFTDRANVRAP
ncbi:MAG: polysaccharide biosynthesis C-terminal domain-containing protein [Hyphomonadaceae bacterium]|nr:polysaccharide biosynthesis C-terminal domain-containing protein [Hyphomonadaceae bacterium]